MNTLPDWKLSDDQLRWPGIGLKKEHPVLVTLSLEPALRRRLQRLGGIVIVNLKKKQRHIQSSFIISLKLCAIIQQKIQHSKLKCQH